MAALARVDAAVVELVACGPLRSGEPARATFTTGAPAAAQELTLFDLEPLGDAELDDVELEVQAEAAQRLVGELAALEQESREALASPPRSRRPVRSWPRPTPRSTRPGRPPSTPVRGPGGAPT